MLFRFEKETFAYSKVPAEDLYNRLVAGLRYNGCSRATFTFLAVWASQFRLRLSRLLTGTHTHTSLTQVASDIPQFEVDRGHTVIHAHA